MLCTLSCLPSLEIGKKICGSCVRHPAYTHSILFTQLDYSQQVGLCARVCLHMHVSGFFFLHSFYNGKTCTFKDFHQRKFATTICLCIYSRHAVSVVWQINATHVTSVCCAPKDALEVLWFLFAHAHEVHEVVVCLASHCYSLVDLMVMGKQKPAIFFLCRPITLDVLIGEKQCEREKQQCLLLFVEHEIEQH